MARLPRQDIRLPIGEMLWDILLSVSRANFPDLPLLDGGMYWMLLAAIYVAEARDRPHTRYTLAQFTEVPLETLRRHLHALVRLKAIRRDGHHYRVNAHFFTTPASADNLRNVRRAVLRTARRITQNGRRATRNGRAD